MHVILIRSRLHLCLFQRLLLTISPLKCFAANFLREGALVVTIVVTHTLVVTIFI